MSTTVVINGLNYYIPAVGENNWGQNVSDALIALATAAAGSAGFLNRVSVSSSPTTVVSGRTYLVDTSGARTLNLPAPANNAYLLVKDVTGSSATNNITIHPFAGEEINGVASDKVLSTSKGFWMFVSDGTNWFMLTNEDTQSLGRDGTVLLPFYTFGLDPNTGIYSVGSDILGIATGGVVGITINATQQLTIPKTSNQMILGTTNTVTLSATAPAASRTLTIPDPGAAADFLLTAGAQTITGAKTFASSALLLQEVSSTDAITIAVAALAASRIYTLPDAGAAASFVLSEGTLTINGAKTFSDLRGTLGAALAAGNYKITGLANGTAATDAAAFGQVPVITAGQIAGTATSDDAAAGKVGEYIVSSVSAVNFPASSIMGDLTSISLTAGDWDVRINASVTGLSTTSVSGVFIGASVTAGNSFTGLNAQTSEEWAPSSAATNVFTFPMFLSSIRLSLSATTTIYLKYYGTYTGTAPKLAGCISARRIR